MTTRKKKINGLKSSETSMINMMVNIDDWLHGSECLSWAAQGAYFRLLCHYYKTGKALPYDLDQIGHALKYKNIRTLRLHLDELIEFEKFRIEQRKDGPVMVNDRAEAEIRYYHARKMARSEVAKEAGAASGRVRARVKAVAAPEPDGVDMAGDIASISRRYGVDIDIENDNHIEQKQAVSGTSISILPITRTSASAQAHAQGGVQAPARVTETPAPVKTKVDLNDWMASKKAAKPPLPPEEQALKQRTLALLDQIEDKVHPFLKNQSTTLTAEYVEKWLKAGADPDYHIFPVIDNKLKDIAAKGMRVFGLGLFDDDVMAAIRRGAEATAKPTTPAPSSSSSPQSRYPDYSNKGVYQPRTEERARIEDVRRLARANGWTELLKQMIALMKIGDEESSRKLNQLAIDHEKLVLIPYEKWERDQSSAA